MFIYFGNHNTQVAHQFNQFHHIADERNIGDGYFSGGEQYGRNDLQSLIFGALRNDFAFEFMTTCYFE